MDAWHRTSDPPSPPEDHGSDDKPGRERRLAGKVTAGGGGCLVLMMVLIVAFQAALVLLLVPDTPSDPDGGGIHICTTAACIVEARTVFPALIVAILAAAAGLMAFLRPSWITAAACVIAALLLVMLDVDPDVEGVLRPAALGMIVIAAGTWLRLPVPVPPSVRSRFGTAGSDILRSARAEISETWRDAGLPAPRRRATTVADDPSAPPGDTPDAS